MSVQQTLSEEDRHYIGGLIDSEGSIYISVGKENRTTFGYRARPKVELIMKLNDGREKEIRELLTTFADDAGVSSINENFKHNQANYGCWKFGVYGYTNVLPFLREVHPYLRLKSRHAEMVLDIEWPGANSDRDKFMSVMETRDELREINADQDSKYDAEYFRTEVDL